MNQTSHTLINGLSGMAASTLAVLTTFQEQLEWWIRFTGGVLGIVIALITLYNLIANKRRPPFP